MSVLLPFLRPLAAMPFIIDGLDAVVNSDEHAQRLKVCWNMQVPMV